MKKAENKIGASRIGISALRIGYLPFYVDYYEGICPDFPREKAAAARRCAEALSKHGEVIWNGELIRDVAGAEAAGRRLAGEKPDCVVVFTSIAVFGGIPWAALQHLNAPILIWNAQAIQTVGRGYTMVEIVRNTGQIGTQALANTLLREGQWFRVVTGYEKSARTMTELEIFFRIIRAVFAVKRARLLAIGESFPMMTDILIDEDALRRHIGATIVHVGNEDLTERYSSGGCHPERSEGSLLNVGKEILRCAQNDKQGMTTPKVRIADLTPDEAARSARLSAAVNSLIEEHHADGGTLNCHGTCLRNPEIGITACYSLGVQNSLGRPFPCTGGLPTAVAMLLLKKLTGVSMYTEVQVMDEKRRAIVIANSGEGEDGIRRAGCKSLVRGNTNFKGVHGRGASFAYPLQPGPATIVSFTPSPRDTKRFRLIVAEGEILKEPLPDAGALAGFFRFKNSDLHTAYTQWLEAGAVHHAATAPGHWASSLRMAAELLKIEYVEI